MPCFSICCHAYDVRHAAAFRHEIFRHFSVFSYHADLRHTLYSPSPLLPLRFCRSPPPMLPLPSYAIMPHDYDAIPATPCYYYAMYATPLISLADIFTPHAAAPQPRFFTLAAHFHACFFDFTLLTFLAAAVTILMPLTPPKAACLSSPRAMMLRHAIIAAVAA